MIALTFDLETENHILYKRKASPFDERNYIVQIGWSVNGGEKFENYFEEYHREPVMPDILDDMGRGDILIGFNIKFDLLWVWSEPRMQAALKRGVTIYCGQYAEYLLGGMTQDTHMTAMNDIAESYGGGCKIDAVKEMWQDGVLTSEIPRDLLTDYLIGDGEEIVGDVENTWLIYCGQVRRMKEDHPPAFRTMFKFRMNGLLATCEIEHNGVHCDKVLGEELRKGLLCDIDIAATDLNSFIPKLPPELEFNWASNLLKSCIIFGGVARYEKWTPHKTAEGLALYCKQTIKWPLFLGVQVDPAKCIKLKTSYMLEIDKPYEGCFTHKGKMYLKQDRFKAGKRAGEPKYKGMTVADLTRPKGAKQNYYFKFPGYVTPRAEWKGSMTDAYDEPLYSVSSKVLDVLATEKMPFTNALMKHTKFTKDLSTYYWTEAKSGKRKGMLTLVNDESIIHHKLNCVNTVTSRLSSSDPNLQTIPRKDEDDEGVAKSEVKKMFSSRFGDDGVMIELDYSQLEVIVQAILTNDKQMQQDLNDKVDFHCKRLAAQLHEDYDYVWDKCHVEKDAEYKRGRTNAKKFSFQRAYGAGAGTIATDTGMPKREVDALILSEESLYPSVGVFDRELERTIKNNRFPTDKKLFIDGVVFTQGESYWDSPTGTRYAWKEGITPQFMHTKGKYTGFSPTERKNYPVQGFGGEIMQTMLGEIYLELLKVDFFDGKVKLVNTVHDCVWLDCRKDVAHKAEMFVKSIMESVPKVFNEAFGLDINVPFPVEAEMGPNMFDLT